MLLVLEKSHKSPSFHSQDASFLLAFVERNYFKLAAFRGGEWRWRKTHVKRDILKYDFLFAYQYQLHSFIIMSFTLKERKETGT